MATGLERPLRFRGPPTGLTAMIVGVGDLVGPVPVAVSLPGAKGGEFPADVTPYEGRVRLYLALPRATAPGRYEGEARLGEEARSVVLEVEAEPELDVEPGSVRLAARAGERVRLELTLYNAGNVPASIPDTYAFGLFPDLGAERAILQSHTAKGSGSRRLDVFVDALADEFAGTVRVRVDAGEGAVERGAARDVAATLVMPEGLRAGRSYGGTWEFEGFHLHVRVDVPQEIIR